MKNVLIVAVLTVNTLLIAPAHSESIQSFPCDTDLDCSFIFPSSKCVQKMCQCGGGGCEYTENLVTTKIGEICTSLQDCNVVQSYCLHEVCTCKTGTIESSDGKKCLEVSKGIGSSCMEDRQCSAVVPSSVCHKNICTCSSATHLHNDTCLPSRNLGDTCSISEECITTYSECDIHCKCISRYIQGSRGCLLVSNALYSPCEEDVQCQHTLGIGSECYNGLCNCRDLHQYKATTNKCIRDLLLDEACANHEDCHQPGHGISRLECILGQCKCKPPLYQYKEYCVAGASLPQVFIYVLLSAILALIKLR